jgi:hypothetical protein
VAPDALCAADHPACGSGWSWMVRVREVSSAKAHSRSIDSVRGGPAFRREGIQGSGGLSLLGEKVVAPDALCFGDHPASRAYVGRVIGGMDWRCQLILGT